MKKIYTLLVLCFSVYSANAQSNCETATVVEAGNYTVDTIIGQTPFPSCFDIPGSAGEWFIYTAPDSLLLTITSDLMVNYGKDTRLHVYTGTCDNLTCFATDDDGGDIGTGWLSTLEVEVVEGTTYYIAFDDRWESDGFEFEISENEIPETPPVVFVAQNINTTGSSYGVVDMNGDFLDDVVSVSSTNININYQSSGVPGGFISTDIPNEPVSYVASWSMAAADIDANGYTDLLYGGGGGVTFMMATDDGLSYNEISGDEWIFSQRSNFVDINNDGSIDAFVCHDVDANVYYMNDGEGNLTYNQGGLGDQEDGGNYGSIWVDYDNDGDMDLFIAKCRGAGSPASINEMHQNNGDGSFTEVGAEINMNDGVQTWSSAWGDYDNDGFMDALVGASSLTAGGHKLMYNNGDGTFSDITLGSGYENLNATNIENVTHDFNNDGFLDVYGAGHKIMMNNGDLTFTPVPVGPNNGPVGDLNNDGFLDIVSGGYAWLNQPNGNNYLKVAAVGDSSNINGIGARVELYSNLGKQIRDFRSGDGFRYMSSLNVHFGLGQDTQVDSLIIKWPSGVVNTVLNPEINTLLVVVETWESEEDTSSTVGITETDANSIVVYPNPAEDILYLNLPENSKNNAVLIFDLSGKQVLSTTLKENQINIGSLSSGSYILRIDSDGEILQQSFIKN